MLAVEWCPWGSFEKVLGFARSATSAVIFARGGSDIFLGILAGLEADVLCRKRLGMVELLIDVIAGWLLEGNFSRGEMTQPSALFHHL